MEKKKEFSSAGPACERRFLCFASKYGHRPDTFYVPSLAPTDPSAAARQEWDSDGKQSWWLLTGPLTIYLLHQIPAQRRRWTSRAIPDRNTGEKKTTTHTWDPITFLFTWMVICISPGGGQTEKGGGEKNDEELDGPLSGGQENNTSARQLDYHPSLFFAYRETLRPN